jgi:hypothetical protein
VGGDGSSLGRQLPQQLIDALVGETEAVRELELIEPIEAISILPEDLRLHIQRELANIEMTRATGIMRAFGFMPEDVDLEELILELYSSEVIGLYDPETDRLMVLRTIANRLGSESVAALEARAVLVHELTHALQDQHFDTLDHIGDEAWTDDQGSVYSCLSEGDATLAMLISTMRSSGLPIDATLQPGFREQAQSFSRAALPASAALSEAPPYFGHVMAATYFEGLTFAADLRRLGGWRAVDGAHRNPPRGTRDILHPERYLEGRTLVEISLPEALPGLEMPAFRRLHTAVLGELETGAFLLPLQDEARLREAATGWAGDRFAVYEAGDGSVALAWRLRFESVRDAGEFFDAAVEATVASGRGPCRGQIRRNDPSDETPRFAACSLGRDRIDENGLDVAVVRNVPPERAEALIGALLSASAVERPLSPPLPELLERISEL